MIWSAPCEAIARNAPPMRPANIVCGRSNPVYQSMACSLPGGTSRVEDRAPAAVDGLADQDQRRDAADDVDARLQQLRPDHRLHAAAIRVDHRQHAEHDDRRRHRVLLGHHRPDDQRDRNRRREDAHGIRHRARDHEHDRREASRAQAESRLEQRVRRDQIAVRSTAAAACTRRRCVRRCSRRPPAGIRGCRCTPAREC